MANEKYCKKCDSIKCIDEFARDNRAKSGRQVDCKECQRKYYFENKSRYQKLHKQESYKKKVAEYQKKNSEKINEYKRFRYSTEYGKAKVKAINAERRAIKKSTSDGTVNAKLILDLLKSQDYKCAISGKCIKDNY